MKNYEFFEKKYLNEDEYSFDEYFKKCLSICEEWRMNKSIKSH